MDPTLIHEYVTLYYLPLIYVVCLLVYHQQRGLISILQTYFHHRLHQGRLHRLAIDSNHSGILFFASLFLLTLELCP